MEKRKKAETLADNIKEFRRIEVAEDFKGKNAKPGTTVFEAFLPALAQIHVPTHMVNQPLTKKDPKTGLSKPINIYEEIAKNFRKTLTGLLFDNPDPNRSAIKLVDAIEIMIKDSHEHTGRPYPLMLQKKFDLLRAALDVGEIPSDKIPRIVTQHITNEQPPRPKGGIIQ